MLLRILHKIRDLHARFVIWRLERYFRKLADRRKR